MCAGRADLPSGHGLFTTAKKLIQLSGGLVIPNVAPYQVTTHPQSTHRPIYVDSVPHVNPDDQYTNQRHVTEPQGIMHPQSTYISTYNDLMPHVKPQDQYDQYTDLNQPLCIVPGISHPQSVHDSVYVDSGHMNPHDQHTNQSHDIVPQGPPYPQNTHRSACVDSVPHVNPDDQYTNQRHDTDIQVTSHPQITHLSTYNDSIPHTIPQDQYVNQPPCIDTGTSRSQTMPYSKYVDSGFHALKSQDKYANQLPYIDPGTSHPQTMHDSVYVDSGGHMTHNQYINQSYDIIPQGPPHPQNTHYPTYIDPIFYVNPDDQYTNQRHDTDLQAISHPQITHVSTYNDSMPHTKPHNQSNNHSNFSNDHPGPEQFTLASQTTHYPPAHGLNSYHHVGDAYYHTPHPKMSYERPDPLIQSSNWMHGLFDVHNTSNGVEGGPSHTPYTISKRRNDYLTPHDVEHSEGSSHSAAQSVLPLVLDTQPVTIPSPVVPKAPSPVPVALLHVTDLSKVKSAALFRMKCTIFINSFFLDAATVRKMAHKCMDAEVSHDDDLVAWSKTSDGELEVSKLCKALGTIKKNIQFLSHSAVLWGYDLHYLLMEKPKKEIQGKKVEITFGNIAIRYFA
ncbi:hypothetical protein BD769DRAFT_1387458 [Suillus cothurnatus]|nr:hypothetical protein BD769DRAFT_1387458 [Suillus cothurnatus]